MMKTSNSSSLSYKRALQRHAPWMRSFFAMVLVPFGSVDTLLKEKSFYQGFEAKDPVLQVFYAQKTKYSGLPQCRERLKSIISYRPGVSLDHFTEAFSPWSEEDNQAVTECDSFPCDIKLNPTETKAIQLKTPEQKREEFQRLVLVRVDRYKKGGERLGYRYPENPIDPWNFFQKAGFELNEAEPKSPYLLVRRLDFSPKKMRPLRQVLDVRSSGTIDTATVWVRDVYTAHYFDSWGEYHQGACDAQGTLTLLQSLVVEFDLLKKKDLLSSLARGNMRSALEENGHRYLKTIREKFGLPSRLEKNQKPK